jgi:hypothetical protein
MTHPELKVAGRTPAEVQHVVRMMTNQGLMAGARTMVAARMGCKMMRRGLLGEAKTLVEAQLQTCTMTCPIFDQALRTLVVARVRCKMMSRGLLGEVKTLELVPLQTCTVPYLEPDLPARMTAQVHPEGYKMMLLGPLVGVRMPALAAQQCCMGMSR